MGVILTCIAGGWSFGRLSAPALAGLEIYGGTSAPLWDSWGYPHVLHSITAKVCI